VPTTFKEADETSSFVAANFGERELYGGHSGQPGVANEACVHWVSGKVVSRVRTQYAG
jgi:DNA-binding GntR family transcriptional regulator